MGFDKLHRPLVVKSGDKVYNLRVTSASLTPTPVAANKVEEETFTVAGINGTYDVVLAVNSPGLENDVSPVSARVSATNTVAIAFANPTGASGTPKSGTYKIILLRKGA